ncbi:leucine-rich repeat and IQ domain-containing protein 1 isoform X1 [Tachysurus ichikawai]
MQAGESRGAVLGPRREGIPRGAASVPCAAGRGDVSAQEAVRGEPEQTYKHTQTRHRTYQWLQTQAMPSRKSSAPSVSDHFLPEIDPKILNGGKVQLVASTDYRETPDSAVTIDNAGFSSPQNDSVHTQIHSAGHASGSQILDSTNDPKLANSNKLKRDHLYVFG